MLLLILSTFPLHAAAGENGLNKATDPLKLAATDTEMMWLREDGSYKYGIIT